VRYKWDTSAGTRLETAPGAEDRLPVRVREVRLFTGERSEADLRLHRRLRYTGTHRPDASAGYTSCT
jgi:hypothetical protein